MLSKSALLFAFVAIARVAVAAPPGCLLGAVNTYKSPYDVGAVCKAKDATQKIAKYCGDSTEDALSAFADICNDAGVKVATEIPTTATATATATVSSKSTGTGFVTTTASGTAASGTLDYAPASQTPTPTGTGENGETVPSGSETGTPPQFTGAAGTIEIAGAALFAGLMAIAL
ncbi:hypothetical protein CC78DRAFT_578002 [Lojkania enalia]|uniref:Uncharacterized protein n=1 Tax=Lojkania enalia TaxID=147567 RepID=A0A9P4KI43_9PLEO|nr:hypothetical protein CC78DRAFT_578002 [Didymosphaeria enalia]